MPKSRMQKPKILKQILKIDFRNIEKKTKTIECRKIKLKNRKLKEIRFPKKWKAEKQNAKI